MAPKHILIISYTFPPFRGIGGRRWAKFAKQLARRGHTVHVIHCAPEQNDKGSHWNADIEHERIKCYPLPKKYPTVLTKRPLTSLLEKIAYRYWTRILPLRVKGNYFDKSILWKGQLLRVARKVIIENGVKNVVVTGAPFRLLYFATELKHLKVNLIGDFRDPWTWSDVYGYKELSPTRMAYEQMMEHEVVHSFHKVLSPAPAILEHLQKSYTDVERTKFVRISHAFDKDDVQGPMTPKEPGKKVRFIYAGSMYGAHEAEEYFQKLMQAFVSIRKKKPELVAELSLDLYITGHGVDQYKQMVLDHNLDEVVNFLAPLPATEIFQEILNSDYVLIFIPSINKDFMGTKFSEIFSLGVPVLHVGPEGFVSRFVEEHQTGISIRVAELQEKLEWILQERPRPMPDRSIISSLFDIDRITDQLEHDILI